MVKEFIVCEGVRITQSEDMGIFIYFKSLRRHKDGTKSIIVYHKS